MQRSFMLKETEAKIHDRITELQAQIKVNSARIGEAASLGDLKENAEYKAAKEEQVLLFKHLERFESYLTNVTVIDRNKIDGKTVTFGTRVKIRDLDTDKIEEYNLLGTAEFELELYPNIMTNTAPLARSLMGKKVGDIVNVSLPRRRRMQNFSYEIIEINVVEG